MEAVRHDAEHRSEHPNKRENAGQDKTDNPAEISTLSSDDHIHTALNTFQPPVEAIHATIDPIQPLIEPFHAAIEQFHTAIEPFHAVVESVHSLIKPLQSRRGRAGDMFEQCNPAFHIGRIPAVIAWINRNIGHDATPL